MGEIISIRGQIHPFEFRIGYTTGAEGIVSVDPDKQELFAIYQKGERESVACPFLRQHSSGEKICTVYASRPELCRSYQCSVRRP